MYGVRLRRRVGVRVGADDAVAQADDAGGVGFGQFRVVGDHDHQAVAGHLLEQFHDLDAGLAVQRAGGLVRQQNVRVVDQRAGDGHPLHLAAGQLVGQLVDVLAQAHLLQRRDGAAAALGTRHAGDGQRQFHIGQDGLVGDQVVALEDEAHRVVAVGVPVAVVVLFGRDAVDDQIAAVIAVQAADDVQQRGLAGTGRPQDGDKLIVAEAQVHMVQRLLHQAAGFVLFADLFDL